ncbi:MAG: TonB-dependent receptor, partial [Candidatus Tectomicrobia bacterium]|nr:TonB-dependent receptor [Candidatus Tectomicrobia bacterium]
LTDSLGRGRIIVRGLRATGGENVLILFNGHRLNEVITGGATAINLDIPVDNLERIEIIRGPGSALFGANAFAGVVNLIPYTADSLAGVRLSAAGGSFTTQQYNMLAGHEYGDLRVSGFVQFRDTNGPEQTVQADVQTMRDMQFAPFPASSRAPGKTDDERQSVDANAHLVYKGLTLNSRFKYEHAGGYIGLGDRLSDSRLENQQIAFDASYRHALGEQGNLLTRFSFTQNESRQLLELLPPGTLFSVPFPDGLAIDFDAHSRRFSGDLVLSYSLRAQHDLTLGISLAHEATYDLQARGNYEDTPFFGPSDSFRTLPFNLIQDSSRTIFSVIFQDIWSPLPELDITLGVRYDHFSDFEDTIDPRVGVVWRFAKYTYLKLLYGSAFRAPTFFELSFDAGQALPGIDFASNPDLDPTTLQTIEAALGYTRQQVRVSANYFYTFARDFIVLTPGLPGEPLQFQNSLDIDIQGVEVEMQATRRNHTFFANYTYQHPKNKTTGKRVADVPEHLANLGVSMGMGQYVRLTPTLLIRGSRPRAEGDLRDDSSAYALVNVSLLIRKLFRTLEISGTVHNLFDTDYEDPARNATVPGDYPRAGRSVLIKATYTF